MHVCRKMRRKVCRKVCRKYEGAAPVRNKVSQLGKHSIPEVNSLCSRARTCVALSGRRRSFRGKNSRGRGVIWRTVTPLAWLPQV